MTFLAELCWRSLMTLLYWEWHLIPRWLLRNIFSLFPEQLRNDLVSWGSNAKYSMIDCILGDAFGVLSLPVLEYLWHMPHFIVLFASPKNNNSCYLLFEQPASHPFQAAPCTSSLLYSSSQTSAPLLSPLTSTLTIYFLCRNSTFGQE